MSIRTWSNLLVVLLAAGGLSYQASSAHAAPVEKEPTAGHSAADPSASSMTLTEDIEPFQPFNKTEPSPASDQTTAATFSAESVDEVHQTAELLTGNPDSSLVPSFAIGQNTGTHNSTQPSADAALGAEPALEPINPTNIDISADSEANSQPDGMRQLTSVTQLADVQPTDWAYQALQSLVERYGCIVGYPDSTYRGQRALTRFEFAAGLNACLDRISELIAASTADLVTEEDLAVRQRLADEFQTELAILRGRVDGLEARVAELEANQFSTTTVLRGNAIFAVADVFGEDGGNNTVFQHRENLNLITSFGGEDVLFLGLYAGNAPLGSLNADPPYTGAFDLAGTEVDAVLGGEERSVKASTAEGTLSSQFAAQTGDVLQALTLGYSFPVGNDLEVAFVHALAPFQLFAPTLNPYLSDLESGTGAISVFGEHNPIYTLSSGGTGLILNYTLFDEAVRLTAGYLADGMAVGNPEPGNGLFNGGYGILGQLTWNVTDNFSIAGVYINEYSPSGRFGFNYNGVGVTGTAVANTLAGQDILASQIDGEQIDTLDRTPVITNGYGVQFNWQPSTTFSISGWFSTFYPRLIGEGDGNILTYALTLAFPDLGQRGNLLGFVVGAEPYLTEMGGNPQNFDVDVPLHVEAFYRHRVNDNIFITPGIIWLAAPNQDNDNGDNFIATLRTTFMF